jgi:predicted peroxiredoxin
MAINFAGMAIKRGHKVTVFLNAYAVHLVDTSITHNIHGPKNKTVQEMISDIQKKGAQIIACGGCIKKAGITKGQLLKGVVIGNADIIFPVLFENNTKVMSW